MLSYLSTLSSFLAYWSFAAVATVAFVSIYLWITPQRELKLIAQGNISAAMSLSGAMLGFVLPMSSALAHSVSLGDLVSWSLVALAVQILVYAVIRLFWHDLQSQIERDNRAVALVVAVLAVTAGALNAAAMTY